MCDAIEKLQKESYEKGIEKGIDKGRFLMIKQLMDVDHLSLTEAMDKFRLTEPERANMLRVYESMNSPNG